MTIQLITHRLSIDFSLMLLLSSISYTWRFNFPCVLIGVCFVHFLNRGNALLIGSIGTHLNSLAALALYMLEYPIHPVDCTYPNTFLDGLRSAVRQAGCDGKTTTVVFTVS